MCGVKANFETVGLDINGQFENCKSSFQNAKVPSLIEWAQKEGGFCLRENLLGAVNFSAFPRLPNDFSRLAHYADKAPF